MENVLDINLEKKDLFYFTDGERHIRVKLKKPKLACQINRDRKTIYCSVLTRCKEEEEEDEEEATSSDRVRCSSSPKSKIISQNIFKRTVFCKSLTCVSRSGHLNQYDLIPVLKLHNTVD
jgi:hypothetical protein